MPPKKDMIILTEGGRENGFGHITRCISIANAFQSKGVNINFIVHGDNSVKSLLSDFKYSIYNWIDGFNKIELLVKDSLLVLIDSIQVSNKKIINISKLDTVVIHIDDDEQRNIINSGFILDWTINRESSFKLSERKSKVTYLLGSKYTPLRSAFYGNYTKFIINDTISQIMITFGGSDIRNMTPRILNMLVDYYPKVRKKVVIGDGCYNINYIKSFSDENTSFVFDASAHTMVKIMNESDIAIASGGQTLYELAKVGIPTIAIILVENAMHDTNGWEKAGFLKNAGWYCDKEIIKNVYKEIIHLQSKIERKRMSDNGARFIGKNGANLLAGTILKRI